MPITTLTSDEPVRRSVRQSSPDYAKLEAATLLADEGRPLDALRATLEHLFPGRPLPDLAREAFTFHQGSSKLTTRIENDRLVVEVPLVRLPSGGSAVAALRYVLTEVAASGQLYQPRLRGDDLFLEYRDRLSRFHPAKLVEVMRRMPADADRRDDLMIGQFSALPLDRVDIAALDDAEVARCESVWRRHWNDVEELLKESQRKRSLWFLNELTAYATNKIAYALPLCGVLMSRIDAASRTYNDSDVDPLKREAALAKCVREAKAVTSEELRKNLGHAEYAMSPLHDGMPAKLTECLGPGGYMKTVAEQRKSGQSIDAALSLVSTYTFLLARFSWPEDVESMLRAGLAEASGKPFREMADLLFRHAGALVEQHGEESDDHEEGDDDASGEADEDDADAHAEADDEGVAG